MNYGQLKAAVLTRLPMGSTDPLAPVVGDLVNEALHILESSSPTGWPWNRTFHTLPTVAAQEAYAFTDFTTDDTIMKVLSIRMLVGSEYVLLTPVGADEADNLYTNISANNASSVYYVEGQTIYLRPYPDGVYTLRCRVVVAEPDMVNDTESPRMPPIFHGAIISATMSLVYQTLQDQSRMAVTDAQVQAWVARMFRYGAESAGKPRIAVREGLWA